MIILSIKTDQKTAEVGLFDSKKQLDYIKWQAHMELSATIHKKIEDILQSQKLSWSDIEAIVFYEGPGSFTGLRIGASVANALAASHDLPVVQTSGDDWINEGIRQLSKDSPNRVVIPEYGSPVHTTKPRK